MRLKKLLTYTPQFSKRVDDIILYAPFILAALMFTGCVIYEILQPHMSNLVRIRIYDITGPVAIFASFVLCALYGRKYGIGLLLSFIYSLTTFFLVFSLSPQLWSELDYEIWGESSRAPFRSALLLPVLSYILAGFDRDDTLTLCDYLVPYYFFHHGVVTHACWVAGCCCGKTMNWGIINPYTGLHAFPAQPYVIILALGISLWGLLYAKKHNYNTNGKIYGYTLIVYGFFRFVMEFFTDDLRILGQLSLYSLYSLVMILLGVLVFFRKPKSPVEINTYKTTDETMEEQI